MSRIVEIDELMRLVIDDLVEISPRTAVSFALTCRSLEEPTLSSLWKQQSSLNILLKVLPGGTLVEDRRGVIGFADDPSAKDLARLHRYASWMRTLWLGHNGILTTDALSRLSTNSPGGLLFPKLECLVWTIHETETALPFFRLFLSPRLQETTLYVAPALPDIPDLLPHLVQIISLLPTSLGHLSVECAQEGGELLTDAVSSFACRCGPSLKFFETSVPLSEAAIDHLIQLPNLSQWTTIQAPPRVVPTPIFPSLESIHLDGPDALPWLHLLASLGRGTPWDTPATSHTRIRETLKSLICPMTIVDSTLLSSAVNFQILVYLRVSTYCSGTGGCIFRLTDDNMESLATALPRLENLQLGRVCQSNSCNTTVASLLSISVRCLDLAVLETHFNTRTIVGDMQRLLDGGAGRERAKCKLRSLAVGSLPLQRFGDDTESTVAMGFKAIFPCLADFNSWGDSWHQLKSRLVNNPSRSPSRS